MSTIEPPRFCSQCGSSVVVADASFCKNCGAPLSPSVWLSRNLSWRPFVAVVLSLLPGLGHWYKGARGRAVIWFVSVVMLLIFATPVGEVLWLICALNAGLSGALRAEALANSTSRRLQEQRNRWRHGSRQMPAQPPGW